MPGRRKRSKRNSGRKKSVRRNTPVRKPAEETPAANTEEKENQHIKIYGERFSGPWPHPEILSRYDMVKPGFSDRAVEWVEKEQAHRHWVVEKVVGSDQTYRTLGIIFAFIILMTMIGGSVYLVAIDKDLYGVGLFGVSLAGIIRLFVQVKNTSK